MQLSEERYRSRWLILVGVWMLVAATLYAQAEIIRRYLEIIGGLGLRGASEAGTPLKQIFPAFAADAETWVRHALSLLEGHELQLRFTTIDNAPDGRAVYWNSAWAWVIAGAGWGYHIVSGLPLARSVEAATVWLTPSALFVVVVAFSSWATRRAGAVAGVFVAVALTCHDRIHEGFFPTYVDHHGLLTVAVFGLMLGAVMMGGGWWQTPRAGLSPVLPATPGATRHAAIFSAICGALGMWVSAASTLPPIALVGGSGLLTVFLRGRSARGTGAVFAAQAWRTWGRVGGGASFAFYLLEYFPSHLGWRLEANHPLYALAWLGGGELIAEIAEWWLAAPGQSRLAWRRLAWPLLTVLAPPLVILIGGQKVFILLDPFLARLHSNYIQEFLPIWRVVRGANATMIFQVILVDCLPLLAGLATLSFLRREAPIVLWFATLAGLLFNLMAWWQSRWLLNSSGVQICLALVLLATWTRSAKPALRWLIAIALVGTLYVPSCVIRLRGSANEVRLRRVGPRDAVNALYRDIAGALRASQPEGEITLLASPNGSTNIGYYGRFRTLGTLYWENRDGLKAAAAIFSARPDGEAPALLRRHHVTHIAIVSEENFIQPYFELLNPGAPAEQVTQGLGYRLLVEKSIPQWLEVIPYRLPDDLRSLNITVMLFKVNFEQSLPDALYRVALAQLAQGEIEVADHTLDQVIAQAPQAYQSWLRKGELLLARHRWNDAAEAMAQGIALAPAAERPALSTAAAKSFYEQHQHAIAIRIYEASLRDHPTADNACYLAWILATSRDQSLRDGTQALQLARQAVKANPNSSTFLITLAAALAETGRWPEAVTAADQALANSRLDGSPASIQQVFQQRLEQLKSGQPLRN